MQLWYRNSILEFENREVCDLYFDAFKANKSFAKTTANIICVLNAKKEQLEKNLEDYEKAYKSIKNDISFVVDENPNQNYSSFLKYSAELGSKISHIEFLKYEVFQAFKENQTRFLAEFSLNPEKYSHSEKVEMKKTADEICNLYTKFDNTKSQLDEALQSDAVTLDQVLFVESQINTLRNKLETFPFSTEEDYSEMLNYANLISGMLLKEEDEEEFENA